MNSMALWDWGGNELLIVALMILAVWLVRVALPVMISAIRDVIDVWRN